jgi:hypothetical protein
MVYCSFCSKFIGLFTIQSYCNFCSNLRRIVLIYKETKINDVLRDNLIGVDIVDIVDMPPVENLEKSQEEKDVLFLKD